MGRIDKLKTKLLKSPNDFLYSEAKTLLENFGFNEYTKGKTSGARVKFFRNSDGATINLHKPHPGRQLKVYCVKDLIRFLKEIGELE
jgi:hypothetical protein